MLTGRDAFAWLDAVRYARRPFSSATWTLAAVAREHAARYRAPVEALPREGPEASAARHRRGGVAIDDEQHRRARHDTHPSFAGGWSQPFRRRPPWSRRRGVSRVDACSSACGECRECGALLCVGVSPADAFGPGPTRTNPRFPYPARTDVALSPDGTLLVFSARKEDASSSICIRVIDSSPRRLREPTTATARSSRPTASGSVSGRGQSEPGAIGELKKMRLDGSPAVIWPRSRPFVAPRGARTTSSSRRSTAKAGCGVCRQSGGVPQTLTRRRPERCRSHSLPHMLPDGRGVLYTVGTGAGQFRRRSDCRHVARDGRNARRARSRCRRPVCAERSPRGTVRDGTLMAAPFDLKARVTGTPAAIVKDVMQAVHELLSALARLVRRSSASRIPAPSSTCRAPLPGTRDVAGVGEPQWHGDAIDCASLDRMGTTLSPDGQRVALFTLAGGP